MIDRAGNTYICKVQVPEPPGYWHSHSCDRPAKHTIVAIGGLSHPVCGIHKRVHDRHPFAEGNFV